MWMEARILSPEGSDNLVERIFPIDLAPWRLCVLEHREPTAPLRCALG